MNEAKEQLAFDPSIEHPEASGVPADLHIDLPFPMLMATVEDVAIVAKIVGNEYFTLCIVDLFPKTPQEAGRPLKTVNIRFGATPPDVEVGRYWSIAMQTSAQAFYEVFKAERAAPKLSRADKPSLAVINGGVVKAG